MTETSQPPEPATPPPAGPGFFAREAQRLLPHIQHAEAGAGRIAADVQAALQDHAGVVLDVAGDVIQIAKLVDPADTALLAALGALIPKALAMAEKAAVLAQGALKS